MKKIATIPVIISLLLSALFFSCEKNDEVKQDEKVVDNGAKNTAIKNYVEEYLGSVVTDLGWTGNTADCNAGTISADAQQKTLQRINYYRKLAGLPADIVFDEEWNAKCQQAALMMYANNSLSHSPPTSWKCYTSEGKEAAGKSNLGLGSSASRAIDSYVRDNGGSNQACGHRRWILYSKAAKMGHGSTSRSDALWTIGGTTGRTNLPEFIAWPPASFVPAPLVYARWSCSVPKADFSKATVSMIGADGQPIALSVVSKTDNGYGDNTIVWEPQGIDLSLDDQQIKVEVKNVGLNGAVESYSYTVTIIQVD